MYLRVRVPPDLPEVGLSTLQYFYKGRQPKSCAAFSVLNILISRCPPLLSLGSYVSLRRLIHYVKFLLTSGVSLGILKGI